MLTQDSEPEFRLASEKLSEDAQEKKSVSLSELDLERGGRNGEVMGKVDEKSSVGSATDCDGSSRTS